LGKRKNVAGNGSWNAPGGHVEFGEKLTDAALGELREETGLVANDIQYFSTVDDPREDVHYIHICFLTRNFSGEPAVMEPDKCSEWRWFDLQNLPDPIFTGHIRALESLKKNINFLD
jgi:8-oxo-dGTP diphosphatase